MENLIHYLTQLVGARSGWSNSGVIGWTNGWARGRAKGWVVGVEIAALALDEQPGLNLDMFSILISFSSIS